MKSFLERNSSSASFYDCTKELRTPLIFFFFSLFFFLHEMEALLKKNKIKNILTRTGTKYRQMWIKLDSRILEHKGVCVWYFLKSHFGL